MIPIVIKYIICYKFFNWFLLTLLDLLSECLIFVIMTCGRNVLIWFIENTYVYVWFLNMNSGRKCDKYHICMLAYCLIILYIYRGNWKHVNTERGGKGGSVIPVNLFYWWTVCIHQSENFVQIRQQFRITKIK